MLPPDSIAISRGSSAKRTRIEPLRILSALPCVCKRGCRFPVTSHTPPCNIHKVCDNLPMTFLRTVSLALIALATIISPRLLRAADDDLLAVDQAFVVSATALD